MKKNRKVVVILLALAVSLVLFLSSCHSEITRNSSIPRLTYSNDTLTVYTPISCTIELGITAKDENQNVFTFEKTLQAEGKQTYSFPIESLEEELFKENNNLEISSIQIISAVSFDWARTLILGIALFFLLCFILGPILEKHNIIY